MRFDARNCAQLLRKVSTFAANCSIVDVGVVSQGRQTQSTAAMSSLYCEESLDVNGLQLWFDTCMPYASPELLAFEDVIPLQTGSNDFIGHLTLVSQSNGSPLSQRVRTPVKLWSASST